MVEYKESQYHEERLEFGGRNHINSYKKDFRQPRSSLKILGFTLYFQLLSVFGNGGKFSYSCLNYYLNTFKTLNSCK